MIFGGNLRLPRNDDLASLNKDEVSGKDLYTLVLEVRYALSLPG